MEVDPPRASADEKVSASPPLPPRSPRRPLGGLWGLGLHPLPLPGSATAVDLLAPVILASGGAATSDLLGDLWRRALGLAWSLNAWFP
uniref:Uncharacterized protein n=1 Tax=Arundo donax TaxID=35708 RepID=A0A0A8ZC69_ARUDO